jgi:hypothetical protein
MVVHATSRSFRFLKYFFSQREAGFAGKKDLPSADERFGSG